MAATFHAKGSDRQVTSLASFSVTLAISAGDGVVAAGSWDQASTTTPTVVTTGGTGSDTFTLIYGPFTSGSFKYAGWLLQSAGAGRTGITVAWASSNPSFADSGAWSFSGLTSPTLDQVKFASALSTVITSGNTPTLTSADEFAIGYAADNASVTASNAPWTDDAVIFDTASWIQHQVLTATTAISTNFTGSAGGTFITFTLTFKAGTAITIAEFRWHRAFSDEPIIMPTRDIVGY